MNNMRSICGIVVIVEKKIIRANQVQILVCVCNDAFEKDSIMQFLFSQLRGMVEFIVNLTKFLENTLNFRILNKTIKYFDNEQRYSKVLDLQQQ